MARFDPKQLAVWTGGSWFNGVPRVVDGISTDSRRIAPGNIFVAIRGPNFNGHDFVSSAFCQGASGAVVVRSDLISKDRTLGPLLAVNDTAKALQQMAANYRQTLNIRVIAVTGSVGKTTVKEMIAGILARRLATAKTIGNWNNEYGLPLSILNMESHARIGVFELGVNHPGELSPLCQLLKPDWGVVTAIGPVHLEYFGSEKAVADEKSVLLKNLPENGIAFLGRDHPWFELLSAAASCRVISLGEHEDADYVLLKSEAPRGSLLRRSSSGYEGREPRGIFAEPCEARTAIPPCSKPQGFAYSAVVRPLVTKAGLAKKGKNGEGEEGETEVIEKKSGETFRFRPSLPGRHFAGNALFAIAVAREQDFDWALIREALETYQPPPMRWQSETVGGVLIINDAYNANPMSMAAALQTFAAQKHDGHKWLVLAGMHELGSVSEEEHKKLGLSVGGFQWGGLITVGRLGNTIADAAEKAGMKKKNIFRCENHSSAARILADFVRPGDAVLFKASRCERLEKALEIWKEIR